MSVAADRMNSHVDFEHNLRRWDSPSFEVRSDVPLSEDLPRLDYLLLCKLTPPGEPVDNSAQTLRHLWPLLPRISVVDYKSPSNPYSSGQLDRLWGYLHTYLANQCALPRHRADGSLLTPAEGGPEVRAREDLCAVLVVAARSPSLDADIAEMGLTWEDLGSGYLRVHGGPFTLYVVELDVVGPTEGDDLLHSFGHGPLRSPEALRFWMELLGSKEVAMDIQDMDMEEYEKLGYKELMDRMLDALPVELVLSHYAPEQRLAGLDRDHQALALPIEVLRLLPEEYLCSLSPEVQTEICGRLRQHDR